jgi:drug/metabolite transporter (DMT)-like permease
MLCAGTLLAPAALLLAPQTAALAVPLAAPRPLAVLLFMAGVTTLVATALMFAFRPRIGAIAAGITYCGEPLFASLFALFVPAALSAWLGVDYPSETVTRSLAIGGGLVLAAILLVQAAPAPPPPGGGPRERA